MLKTIFTVSELNLAAQTILENHFASITVEGEISNLARPASGHLYFSLKDSAAQIRCAMFRQYARLLDFELKNGLLVQLKAKVSIYPDRGDYQLIVESAALAGEGLLKLAYEKLLKKLSEEGLFQENHKKPLPSIPNHIGVITSPTGAAIRDILSVLKRRFKTIPITIFPTQVQGTEAAPQIVRALNTASKLKICDVLILARGGGSLEDLWPFNEESVARAIFASNIPIVTGVGHETDFTIADFVADKRAPTPSAAAELVSPNQEDWLKRFALSVLRLKNVVIKQIEYRSQKLDIMSKRLRHPGQLIAQQNQRLNSLQNRLVFAMKQILKMNKTHIDGLLKNLHTISPLSTLSRGYAIVSNVATGKIIRSVAEVNQNDLLKVVVADGEIKVGVRS